MAATPPSGKAAAKQSIVAIVVVAAALIIGILLIVKFAVSTYGGRTLKGEAVMSDKAVAERLKPVGTVVYGETVAPPPLPVAAAPARPLKTGQEVYNQVCIACHSTGVAGAPKLKVETLRMLAASCAQAGVALMTFSTERT